MKKNTHIRLSMVCIAMSAIMASCGEKPEDTNSVLINKEPEIKTPAEPKLSRLESAKKALIDGKTLYLDLNNCPFDDSGWDGSADPLGGVKCGESYEVSYNQSAGEWTGRGFDEYRYATTGEKVTKTFKQPYPAPKIGSVILWGGTYILLEDGQVATPRTSQLPQRIIGNFSF